MSQGLPERGGESLREQFLMELMYATQPLADASQITVTVASMLGRHLGCHRCVFAEVNNSAGYFQILGEYTNGVAPMTGRYPLVAFGDEVLRLSRQNAVWTIDDVDRDPRLTTEQRTAYRHAEVAACISVPLLKDGIFVSGLAVHQAEPRAWRDDEISLVRFVVGQCWESIERARLMDDIRQQEANLRLATDGTGVGTWWLDLSIDEGEWSQEAARLFQARTCRFTSKDLALAVYSDDRDGFVSAWEQAVSQAVPYEIECRMARTEVDGAERRILLRGSVEMGNDGCALRAAGLVMDVTDQRRLEAELRQNEALLDTVIETAPDPVFAKDLDGRMIIVNAATLQAIGKPKDQVIGRSENEWLDDKAQAAIIQSNDRRIISTGATEEVEEEMLTPEGSRIFAGRKRPLKNDAGETIGIVGVSRDVTELKRIQGALKQSEERARILADSLNMALKVSRSGYFDWTAKDDHNVWSLELLELYGIDPAEFGGTSQAWLDCVVTEDRDSARAAIERSLKTGHFEVEFRIKRRNDGTVRWIIGRGHVFFGPDGHPERMIGINMDITDRKLAEEALRASQERFDLAIQGSNDGIWDWNIADGTLYWSARLKQHLGYAPDFQPTFEVWEDSIHPDDRDRVLTAISDHVAGKTDYFEEVMRDQTCDGHWRWIMARGLALRDVSGRAYRMAGTRTDISQQKALEDQLRDALERAENANRAKSDFVANVSHEIRTPINAVVGISHLLSRHSGLSGRQKEMIGVLQTSAQSLLELITDLLDFAKIETDAVQIETAPFSLNKLISDVVSLVALKAEEKGLNLKLDTGPWANWVFVGDRHKIRQILLNLVSNAVKFTDAGQVALSVHVEEVDNRADVRISIADTGIGIPAHITETIFEKFTQADGSVTRRFGGTGLGLAITRGLARAMQGDITVSSIEGTGSTFVFSIRLDVASKNGPREEGDREVARKEGRRSGICVLIVEDIEPNILVASELLSELGYRYEIARNGHEAIEILEMKPGQFGAILMDLHMPLMGGLEAARRIRVNEQKSGQSRLPIIAVTAQASGVEQAQCLEAGMDAYLTKPFDPQCLEALLDRHAYTEAIG